MSIEFVPAGDIRDDPADLHVVAVNLVPGVMGAGQAKAYADRWPVLRETHRRAVNCGVLSLDRGQIEWIFGDSTRPEGGILGLYLFATKADWRKASQLEWIARGLNGLIETVWRINEAQRQKPWAVMGGVGHGIRSIACPALGCGLGSLRWADVKTLIEASAGRCPEVEWRVYGPGAERRIAS